MTQTSSTVFRARLGILKAILFLAVPLFNSAPNIPAGVLARFEQGLKFDAIVLPNAALYVPARSAPTSLLDAGEYRVQIEGGISVDLRAQYAFQVEASGEAEVLINGNPFIAFSGGGMSDLSKPVRLNKGTNSLLVKLTPSKEGVTQFRLFWKSRNNAQAIPIPAAGLSHNSDDANLREGNLLRTGIAALAEYRCTRCHATDLRGFPELEIDSPNLTSIGSRLRKDWMAEWIAHPAKHMPRLVSNEEAAAISEYLATLGTAPPTNPASGSVANGEKLFATLQCARCHDTEGQGLGHVGKKFHDAALRQYLRHPREHYRWNRMPNFKLSDDEAADLAAFMLKDQKVEPQTTTRAIGRGKELLESSGCMSCHAGPDPNRHRAKSLAEVLAKPESGCLAADDSRAPRFSFAESEREALTALLKSSRLNALKGDSPMEFALRQKAALGCAKCHDSADGVIRLDLIGGKLRPEWVARFLNGEISYKPRPWLAARMPAFEMPAQRLAAGLAALHGIPPVTVAESDINEQDAGTGAKLISAAGGFSCVACHAVGSSSTSLIVESPGINFAYSADRLLKSFFHRWILNPLALDPATKMPVYFDETGRSQLVEIFEGDGGRQIEAIWQYLRLGEKMPPPPTP